MARRVSAIIGMAAIVGLALVLIWRVYLHHTQSDVEEEPAVVSLLSRSA